MPNRNGSNNKMEENAPGSNNTDVVTMQQLNAAAGKNYNQTSLISGKITWTGTAVTSTGLATFFPTLDGTLGGTPIFTTIHSVTATVESNSSSAISIPYAAVKTIALNKIEVNVVGNTGVSVLTLVVSLLGPNTTPNIKVHLTIHGV